MQVLLNTDPSIGNFRLLSMHVDAIVSQTLMRHRNHITRVEVHLNSEDGKKSGADDKRCTMEARLNRKPPVAVTHHAVTVDSAIHGAARTLARAIEHVIGRTAK